jgi:hypothetical protein
MRIGAFGGGSLASGTEELVPLDSLSGLSASAAAIARQLRGAVAYPPLDFVPWSPSELFRANEAGVWYDPSDFSTLFQDSTGATPVWQLGQPVGLVIDKSRGAFAALGNGIVVNGDFSDGATNWTLGASWAVSGGQAVKSGVGTDAIFQNIPALTVGSTYVVEADQSWVGNPFSVLLRVGASGAVAYSGTLPSDQGRVRLIIQAAAAATRVSFLNAANTATGTLDNISVRELPGTHAIQSSAASRPTLQARSNLLTYSEQFDNAAWTKRSGSVTANAITAPDGTLTADLFVEDTALDTHRLSGPTQTIVNQSFTVSVYAKPAGRTRFQIINTASRPSVIFDVDAGTIVSTANDSTGTIENIGDGWYRCTATTGLTPTANWTGPHFTLVSSGTTTSYTGDGTSGMYFWGAQLELGSTATTYQRVTTATDYADIGLPRYLQFDGVDDSLYTAANLNLSGTDKVSVFAGMRKLSDAAGGILVELSAIVNSNAGSFILGVPGTAAPNYYWSTRGSAALSGLLTSDVFPSPRTEVLTGLGDIANDLQRLRVNGLVASNVTADQGTGNFGSYVLYVGRRGNSSVPFNGRLYPLIVRGALSDQTTLAQAEQWVAGQTGVVLP